MPENTRVRLVLTASFAPSRFAIIPGTNQLRDINLDTNLLTGQKTLRAGRSGMKWLSIEVGDNRQLRPTAFPSRIN